LKAASTVTLRCDFKPVELGRGFAWRDTKGQFGDLFVSDPTSSKPDGRPIMRYMYSAYDPSTPEARNKTYKVFHHLYDPDGKRFVTNGGFTNDPLGDPKKLLYPHHRGLGYGFNKVTYGNGKKADTWHCQKDDHVSHEGFLRVEAGQVLARHLVAV